MCVLFVATSLAFNPLHRMASGEFLEAALLKRWQVMTRGARRAHFNFWDGAALEAQQRGFRSPSVTTRGGMAVGVHHQHRHRLKGQVACMRGFLENTATAVVETVGGVWAAWAERREEVWGDCEH